MCKSRLTPAGEECYAVGLQRSAKFKTPSSSVRSQDGNGLLPVSPDGQEGKANQTGITKRNGVTGDTGSEEGGQSMDDSQSLEDDSDESSGISSEESSGISSEETEGEEGGGEDLTDSSVENILYKSPNSSVGASHIQLNITPLSLLNDSGMLSHTNHSPHNPLVSLHEETNGSNKQPSTHTLNQLRNPQFSDQKSLHNERIPEPQATSGMEEVSLTTVVGWLRMDGSVTPKVVQEGEPQHRKEPLRKHTDSKVPAPQHLKSFKPKLHKIMNTTFLVFRGER